MKAQFQTSLLPCSKHAGDLSLPDFCGRLILMLKAGYGTRRPGIRESNLTGSDPLITYMLCYITDAEHRDYA